MAGEENQESMRRFRVTGRFYVFLALVLVGAFFVIRELVPDNSNLGIVTTGASSYSMVMDAVVVRDETVSSYEGTGRVVYIAGEGDTVQQGMEIADLYSTGYTDRELNALETVRKNIRSYHQTILDDIKDESLDRLENNVQAQALEFKRLVENKQAGNLLNVEKQLEESMLERQEYLRANRREDPKLNNLYEQEASRQNAITAWKTVRRADKNGVVSFYLDGYESVLTPETLPELSFEEVRKVIAGQPLAQTASARLRENIFRLVSEDNWYVILYTTDTSWNPVSGMSFQMQMEGVNGYVFVGTVTSISKSAEGVLAQVQVSSSLGPMINRRSGKVTIGANLTGFVVPIRAIITQNGQTGVMLMDVAGGSFVPVEVLSTDASSGTALIDPIAQGSLTKGQRVQLT